MASKLRFISMLATDSKGGFAKSGNLPPWRNTPAGKADMANFRNATIEYGHVLMGRKTWESLGSKPLPSRTNIVLSRRYDNGITTFGADTSHPIVFVNSLDRVVDWANANGAETIVCIGGREIYDLVSQSPYYTDCIHTVIPGDYDADVVVDPRKWLVTREDNEKQYLDLLAEVLKAPLHANRTGVKTHTVFSRTLTFNLTRNGVPILPLLTTKRIRLENIAAELQWMIRGDTTTEFLHARGCNIWDGNSTREFLDSRKLSYPEGVLGPVYGYQWRNWNGEYVVPLPFNDERSLMTEPTITIPGFSLPNHAKPQTKIIRIGGVSNLEDNLEDNLGDNLEDNLEDYTEVIDSPKKGIDQLKQVVNRIVADPTCRRHVVSAWNPEQIDQMALPPCHLLYQFVVLGSELNIIAYMRSADLALGVPYNIASYSILCHLIAQITGLQPGKVSIVMANCHIYEEHDEGVKVQINRKPYNFPQLETPVVKTLEDIESAEWIARVKNYVCHPFIKLSMF